MQYLEDLPMLVIALNYFCKKIIRFNTSSNYWSLLDAFNVNEEPFICYFNHSIYIYTSTSFYEYNLNEKILILLQSGPSLTQACSISDDNYFYLIFGINNKQISSSIWRFSFFFKNWEEIYTNYTRYDLSCTYSESNIYIFGGITQFGITNELLKFRIKDLSIEILSSDLVYPNPRMFGTFTMIFGYVYLIGGENNGIIYGDIWKLSLNYFYWEVINSSGDFEPISRHCETVFAGSIIVFGGINSNKMLSSSLFQFSLDGVWTRFKTSGAMPSPRAGACMVATSLSLYIFDGETYAGYSSDLWRFDFSNTSYTLISSFSIGIAYHNCVIEDNSLLIIFGILENNQYNYDIISYNLSQNILNNNWEIATSLNLSSKMTIADKYSGLLVKIGGEIYGKGINEIALIDIGSNSIEYDYLPVSMFGSSYAMFNKSFYIFSGIETVGNIPIMRAGYFFYKITIEEIPCSPGTMINGNTCSQCTEGSYSSSYNSVNCTLCPKGTYNDNELSYSKLFCMPCPNNTFGPATGLSACYDCPSFSYCPVGAINPEISYTSSPLTSINPTLSSLNSSSSTITNILELVSISIGCLVIFLFLSSSKIRTCFKSADIFTESHNHKFNKPMMLKKTGIGGCYTILFIITSIYVSLSILVYYFLSNISISQGLVPLVSMTRDYPNIAGDISFQIILHNFGGNCPDSLTCVSVITLSDIYFISNSTECYSEENSCHIIFTCFSCKFGSFPELYLKIYEEMCFTSEIEVNITANSGIQNQISSIIVFVNPEQEKVIIGNQASILPINVIYSVLNNGQTTTTGYYVISNTEPTLGSTYYPSQVPFYSTLFLDIILNRENSGLLTVFSQQQASQIIFTGLLGGITGLLQIFGYFMGTSESSVILINKRLKSKQKILTVSQRSNKLDNNFDKTSIIATKASLLQTDTTIRQLSEITVVGDI